MHPKTVLMLVAVVLVGFVLVQGLEQMPVAAPTSMAGVFVGPGSAADAKRVAAWLDALADEIEIDGKLSTPILQTDFDVEKLRAKASQHITMKLLPRSYKDSNFATIAEAYLTQKVGEKPGELTAAQRAAWVQAYRDLADSCRAAAGGW